MPAGWQASSVVPVERQYWNSPVDAGCSRSVRPSASQSMTRARPALTGAAGLNKLRAAARVLENAHAMRVTERLSSSVNYGTTAIEPGYLVFHHTDLEADVRRMNAFIEERVRERPELYFWAHKRFKTRPPGEPSPYRRK